MRIKSLFLAAVMILSSVRTLAYEAPQPAPTCSQVLEVAAYQDFEQETRQRFDDDVNKIQKAEEARIIELRNKLARIINRNPMGFNTYSKGEHDGIRVHIKGLLRIGQERRIKMLVADEAIKLRHLYRDYQHLQADREEAFQAYLESDLRVRPGLDGLVKTIDDGLVELEREMGQHIFYYAGIVTALLESAGLKPPSSVLADGLDRQLSDDMARGFLRADAVVAARAALVQPSVTPVQEAPPALPTLELARQTALRVLEALRVVENDGKTEISPTLADLEKLVATKPIVRAAKLDAEIAFEKRQRWIQLALRTLSDQYIASWLIAGLNQVTFKQFKDYFNDVQQKLRKAFDRKTHLGIVYEFLGLADYLSADENGNDQLAHALTYLMAMDPGLLSTLATTYEGIAPLKRVKDTPFAKETIWGKGGQKLVDAIAEAEGARSDDFNSALEPSRRTHATLIIGVAGILAYTAWMHASGIMSFSTTDFEAIKTTFTTLVHQLPK